MKNMTLSTRIDQPTKIAFNQICEDIGLSSSQALQLFAKAVVNYGGIPFELKVAKPNSTTIDAMQELRQGGGTLTSDFASLLDDMKIDESQKLQILAGKKA